LGEADLEHIAGLVSKSLKTEEFDRLASQVAKSLRKDDWKLIAEHVFKSLHILHDSKLIAEALLVMPRFWLVLGPILLIGYGILAGLGGFYVHEKATTLFRQEMTNEIRLQFQEPRVSNIVVSIAASQASNLMQGAISPEIRKFEDALAAELKQVRANLDEMQSEGRSNVAQIA